MKKILLILLVIVNQSFASTNPTSFLKCHGPIVDKNRTISKAYFKRIEGNHWVGRGLVLKFFGYRWTDIANFTSVETGTAPTGLSLILTSIEDHKISKIVVSANPNPSSLDTTLMIGQSSGDFSTKDLICTYEDDFSSDLKNPTPSMHGTDKLLELMNY